MRKQNNLILPSIVDAEMNNIPCIKYKKEQKSQIELCYINKTNKMTLIKTEINLEIPLVF